MNDNQCRTRRLICVHTVCTDLNEYIYIVKMVCLNLWIVIKHGSVERDAFFALSLMKRLNQTKSSILFLICFPVLLNRSIFDYFSATKY